MERRDDRTIFPTFFHSSKYFFHCLHEKVNNDTITMEKYKIGQLIILTD